MPFQYIFIISFPSIISVYEASKADRGGSYDRKRNRDNSRWVRVRCLLSILRRTCYCIVRCDFNILAL